VEGNARIPRLKARLGEPEEFVALYRRESELILMSVRRRAMALMTVCARGGRSISSPRMPRASSRSAPRMYRFSRKEPASSGHAHHVTTVEELFRRHAADVLAYALRRADRAVAEDVVSEVFVVAARRLDRIPAEQPVLWLYAVTRRVLANERRSRRRREALLSALSSMRRDSAPAGAASSPLVEALARLRADEHEILMLTAWEGLDAASVAVVLGCSTGAVHTRLHRARARLKAELERQAEPCPEPDPVKVTP
jgi:RNA polymerase sigma-70 factor, ECF subfamily